MPPEQPGAARNSFTGTWRASDRGLLRIVDDGKTLTVDLMRNRSLQTFTGTLTRDKEKPDSKPLTGSFGAVFSGRESRTITIKATATFKVDDFDHLSVHFVDFPKWFGGRIDRHAVTDTWTRVSAADRAPRGRGAGRGGSDDPFGPSE